MTYDAIQQLRARILASKYAAQQVALIARDFQSDMDILAKALKRDKCPNCKNIHLSPAGGTLDGKENYWACWTCGYRINDIQHEEIK